MNMIVATMIAGPSTKALGFLDQGLHFILSPILDMVQGKGYGLWFLIIAFLHPLSWLFFKVRWHYKTASSKINVYRTTDKSISDARDAFEDGFIKFKKFAMLSLSGEP